jgi:hypothetical protein
MLQTQTVTVETLALIKQLMADPRLEDFILVGGTALALTIGHRQSIDIDLFTNRPFDVDKIAALLKDEHRAEFVKVYQGSTVCFIDGIKTDLISHRYPVIKPPETIDGIRIMSQPDIAALKLHAIVNNGTRLKDFVDIHFMLEKMPLSEMYSAYETKYHPNASRDVAKLALRDHTRIDFKEPVMLVGNTLDWPKINARLLQAVERPDKIFLPAIRQQLNVKVEVPKESRNRKRKGIRR